MDDTTIKEIIRIDLGVSVDTPDYDRLIDTIIKRAKRAIEEEGIIIQDNDEDGALVEQYAAWMLRKRKENAPFPRMLRYQLNNRLLSEKMKKPEETEEQ